MTAAWRFNPRSLARFIGEFLSATENSFRWLGRTAAIPLTVRDYLRDFAPLLFR
jgi:hypothetical protein